LTEQPEITEAELLERMNLDLQTGVGNFDDMRMLAKDGQKFIRRAGVPPQIQELVDKAEAAVKEAEVALSGYAIEFAEQTRGAAA
jgi:methionyl-tRNA synthetase